MVYGLELKYRTILRKGKLKYPSASAGTLREGVLQCSKTAHIDEGSPTGLHAV
jgi:hypothetical protein